jgi:hypothetical protein
MKDVKEFVTVKRDREFYGTVSRGPDRVHDFIDIDSYQDDIKFGFKRFVTLDESGRSLNYNIEFTSHNTVESHQKLRSNINFVLDQLVELVYREEFLDVVIEARDIKAAINEVIESKDSLINKDNLELVVDNLFNRIKDLEARLSALPLPTRIFKRVEEMVTVKEPELVKR